MASWSAIARRIRSAGLPFTLLYFWLAKPTVKSIVIGAALLIPGLVIRALASGNFRKTNNSPPEAPMPTRAIRSISVLILAIGFALASRSWWIVAGILLLFFAVYLPVIRSEEEFLRGRFPQLRLHPSGAPLVPRLRPSVKNSGAFSWDLYWKHREYNATLGAAAMLSALLAKMLFWH